MTMSSNSRGVGNAFTADTPQREGVPPSFRERPRRETAVRLCLPGLDTAKHRLLRETAYPLANTLIDGLSHAPHVKELELLTISGDRQVEYFLTPRLGSAPEKSRNVPLQTVFTDFSTQQPVVPDSTADKLAGLAAKNIPEDIGVELCDVDLSSIRMWPVTTGRVLLETNGALRQSHFDWNDPYVETVTQLAATGHPFVVQLIVGTNTRAGYVVTLRYAVIHPAYAIASGRNESEHLKDGKQVPVETVWHNAGLKTNYDLPIRDFARPGVTWDTWNDEPGQSTRKHEPYLQKRSYMEKSDSRIAVDLYTGTTEYRALLHGRPSAPKLYEKLDLHARIPVNDYTLRLFGSLVPHYYRDSPWRTIPGRAGPVVTTRAVIRSAPGTSHSHGSGSVNDSAAKQSSGLTVNTGSEGHDQLLAFAVEYFEGQGEEAWMETQDGSSMPDGGHRTAEGTQRAIEVEFSSLSKPANPLTNYARAADADQPVDFVVTSQGKATRLFEILRTPWKAVTEHGVHLHNLTATVRLATDQLAVVPAKGSESNWYLDADGDLSLRDGSGTVLAQGPADESVRTFDYETPRYDDSGDTHRIVTPDGSTTATYGTRSQLLDDWTLVHAPFVPGHLHALADVRIYYQSGDELVELDTRADWDRNAETATERFRGGLEEFVQTYTREQSGATMLYATFQEYCQELFAVRSRHDPPNRTHIGRALPNSVDVDGGNVSERNIHDRTLLYPPGVVSPDLPFVEEEEEGDGDDGE